MTIEELKAMRAESDRLWHEFEHLERLTNEARTRWCEHNYKASKALDETKAKEDAK
jgi:hypothetical protein